eukprot:GHRR01016533.1.p1 GENE.GHRR01016533.1~~GHRR01016533.1.p1  ORF type:complete len:171 (+),score=50.44 GHRR01016533.1:26-538(+)
MPPAEGQPQPSSSSAAATAAAAAAAAQAEQPPAAAEQQLYQRREDPIIVDTLVERRSEALTEELNDCFSRFWTWVSCGGPAARIRQLYVNGKLSRCWDEYTRFRNCLLGKLNPDQQIQILPEPHPVWQIRTRREAEDFWRRQYAHLGAGATSKGQEDSMKPDLTDQTPSS